jgi:ankyrin repeat protein
MAFRIRSWTYVHEVVGVGKVQKSIRCTYLRRIIVVSVIVAAVFGGLGWYANRSIQRDRLGGKLLYTLSRGDNATARRLLHEGANPNIMEDYSPPPSLWNYFVERLLRRSSAHLCDLGTAPSSTPLLIAVENNNTEMVQVLLGSGADPNLGNCQGETPLMSACGKPEIANLLLGAGALVNPRTRDRGWTALIAASTCGDTAFLKVLIAHGAQVNAVTKAGYTGLMYAAGGGDNVASSILLNAGADANIQATDGMTALQWASREGWTDTMKLLKQVGARR